MAPLSSLLEAAKNANNQLETEENELGDKQVDEQAGGDDIDEK